LLPTSIVVATHTEVPTSLQKSGRYSHVSELEVKITNQNQSLSALIRLKPPSSTALGYFRIVSSLQIMKNADLFFHEVAEFNYHVALTFKYGKILPSIIQSTHLRIEMPKYTTEIWHKIS